MEPSSWFNFKGGRGGGAQILSLLIISTSPAGANPEQKLPVQGSKQHWQRLHRELVESPSKTGRRGPW